MNSNQAEEQEAELLLLLGTMVRDAAHLEVSVDRIAGHLAVATGGADKHAGAALSKIVQACRKTAKADPLMSAEQLRTLEDLLDRTSAVTALRNAYVHGGWARDAGGSFVGVRAQRSSSDLVMHKVSREQLAGMIGEIRELTDGLLNWVIADLDERAGR